MPPLFTFYLFLSSSILKNCVDFSSILKNCMDLSKLADDFILFYFIFYFAIMFTFILVSKIFNIWCTANDPF